MPEGNFLLRLISWILSKLFSHESKVNKIKPYKRLGFKIILIDKLKDKNDFNLLLKSRGGIAGTNLMRRHFSNYIKGFHGASIVRQKLVTALNQNSMRKELSDFRKKAEDLEK